jgi:transketolase|tara:strand:- start:1414 stop:2238 length:825 start_codon:yes stop_codon:yes gene_type:complete
MNSDEKNNIEIFSKNIRTKILDISLKAGASSSHFGGSLSTVDLLSVLYKKILNFDQKNPLWKERDRFILSKGHACLGFYAILNEFKFITNEELDLFEKNNSFLLGHPVMNKSKGIEFSNGSLGMGLSLGVGVAISLKKRNSSCKVFVLIGDGECNEGSIWEAAMSASHFKLENLTVILDNNNLQQTGKNIEIMSTHNLASKWSSFGWEVINIDGHNIKQIYEAYTIKTIKPKLILAKTIKGKGFSFAENNNDWHHKILTKNQYDEAKKEINDRK